MANFTEVTFYGVPIVYDTQLPQNTVYISQGTYTYGDLQRATNPWWQAQRAYPTAAAGGALTAELFKSYYYSNYGVWPEPLDERLWVEEGL